MVVVHQCMINEFVENIVYRAMCSIQDKHCNVNMLEGIIQYCVFNLAEL